MHPSRKRTGFTLIELLTVIAIIAILMGLLLPAMNAAKNAAKKASAKTDLTQLVTAVKSFYSDYGVYPIDPTIGAKDVEYGGSGDASHNSDIINVLRADSNTSDVISTGTNTPLSINTRATVYLDVPLIKDPNSPKSGLGTGKEINNYGISKAGEWYDPFGAPYIVAIDGNYDGYVEASPSVLLKYNDLSYVQWNGSNAVQTGVIAGSFGADHTQGSSSNQQHFGGSDDILSWQ